MSVWVVAADAARARIFAAEGADGALAEIEDRVHPQSRQREGDRTSDAAGSGRSSGGGGHAYTDVRDGDALEAERFAAELASVLDRAAREERFSRLYLLAGPSFMGHLRPHLDPHTAERIAGEQTVGVTHESVADIRKRLPKRL